ncbi:hypothetical protein COB18_01810 [Candidatus Kaiserbacteria bacterium]|nr:MAG: hypothetical protein COB18_01810 [Candidatus Kaiserbacteria bacterium]
MKLYLPEKLRPFLPLIPTIALVAGFILDVFTIDRPDALFENIVIGGHLVLSALIILILQRRNEEGSESTRILLLSILQFSFGNLASALMVLYARSGTFAGSAIFILLLAALFLGNEVLKNHYARVHLRVVIWFTLLLTYSTLIVPVVINRLGALVFLLSTVLVGLVGMLFTGILFRNRQDTATPRKIRLTLIAIIIGFSTLYFLNLIPPVPLALKHIGIYHSVVRSGGTYTLTYENARWYNFWRDTNKSYSHIAGTPVYCFSNVFAPTDLQTEINHRWEKYNTENNEWDTMARIPFPILGGRANGYRGYTQTMQVDTGLWRCSVETARGNLIGRTVFDVVPGTPQLRTREL